MNISFQVPMAAAPQGSKRHMGGGRMVENSAKVAPYRTMVRFLADQKMRETNQKIECELPVRVVVTFVFSRPKSHVRANGELKSWAPSLYASPPDIDKLLRSTFDAMTGVCFKDDRQIAGVTATKAYSNDGSEYVCLSVKSVKE